MLKELIDREVLLSSASSYRKQGQSGLGQLVVPAQQLQPNSTHSNAMQEAQSQTSRTDSSTVSSAVATGRGSVNPATASSHGSHQPMANPNPKPAVVDRGPNPSQQMQLQQYGRRGAPQQQRQQPNVNPNGKNNLAGYRRLSSDSQAFAAAQAGSMEDMTEGPVSQLSTQVSCLKINPSMRSSLSNNYFMAISLSAIV